MSKNHDIYLFFAPPRVGNHWVESLICGLYFVCPEQLFAGDGTPLDPDRASLRSEIKAIIPEVTMQNPVLFLERGMEVNKEYLTRSKEIDLCIVRNLVRAKDAASPGTPVRIQWFHDKYHAKPYMPKLSVEGEVKYIFVKRAPQDTAYSYYRVQKDRWGKKQQNLKFSDVYTKEWLEHLLSFYSSYQFIEKYHRCFIFDYESLKKNWRLLESFCVDFICRQPKLEPEFVWKSLQFKRLKKAGERRTFYRAGKSLRWKDELSRKEIRKMIEVEKHFNFNEIGYPRTVELAGKRLFW